MVPEGHWEVVLVADTVRLFVAVALLDCPRAVATSPRRQTKRMQAGIAKSCENGRGRGGVKRGGKRGGAHKGWGRGGRGGV